ncbi:MAG: glycoside hydrolase family 1 protein [Candidatus Liptonbacteria bacterium]|nr:glycoside hydrolase family 1 protein [Candidatus Liptonbacteria bacterium]
MANGFPKNFYFGAATSAHQVEGGNHNDWTEWENKNALRLASLAQGKPWPDYILNPPAGGPNPLEPANYISGVACDHYNRYEEDFDIAKRLGHNAHRFSIEWSRVEPEEGKWNEKEIEHYRKVLGALRARGIEPFVTLWHWTLPIWLTKKGGTANKIFPEYFARYTEKIVDALGENVIFWITLNEPLVHAKISYLEGRWPPQKKSLFSYVRVSKNLIRAHKKAYTLIKRLKPEAQIGIAHNMSFFEADGSLFLNLILKKFGEWRKNFVFLDAISDYQDFIGFNYYSSYLVNFGFRKIKTEQITDLGWSIYPKGIYMMLNALKKYNKPIFITENGLADAEDKKRAEFVRQHMHWMSEAIKQGVDVRGYFHWSLMDNFEWSDGFWPRFGLVEVDYKTLERKIRPSAFEYKKIIDGANA